MKLNFSREADSEIKVLMEIDGTESEFDYIKFIDNLYSTNNDISLSYSEEITEDEQKKLNEMVEEIKDQVVTEEETKD